MTDTLVFAIMEFDSLLKFAHIYQSRIWGGRRLETLFNRHLPDPKMQYGESWEICDRDQEQSICTLSNGQEISLHDLWVNHREDVFGRGMLKSESPRYPLLMKILDACEDLSIQVHPPASVASSLGGDPKTEMWYIVHAEPGSKIYAGLKNGVTSSLFEQSMNNGSVADCVQILSPESGDCLFIPSGMIHAIGAGLLIFEIQQNSDTTFRVFDWNRLGLDGQPRQLHLLQSLQSIDFVAPPPTFQYPDNRGTLVQCDFFNLSIHG